MTDAIHPPTHTVTARAVCGRCRSAFPYTVIPTMPKLIPTLCDACSEAEAKQERLRIHQRAENVWRALCDPLYQLTELTHPSMPTAAKLHQILAWECGPKGLTLHGATGGGKTRCIWLLLKRLIIAGHTVAAETANDFAAQSAITTMAGAQEHHDWISGLLDADVFFLDDLGKFKLTERVEADLFDVFDRRCKRMLPCIFTTNFNGLDLKSQMSADRGEPFLQRLREYTTTIAI